MENPKITSLLLCLLLASPLSFFPCTAVNLFPSVDAKKLMRQLHLFPKKDINIVQQIREEESDAAVKQEKRITDKRFRLLHSGSAESDIDDLGHHAGYYKLNHSHNAR